MCVEPWKQICLKDIQFLSRYDWFVGNFVRLKRGTDSTDDVIKKDSVDDDTKKDSDDDDIEMVACDGGDSDCNNGELQLENEISNLGRGGVSFIQKELYKKSYPQKSKVKNYPEEYPIKKVSKLTPLCIKQMRLCFFMLHKRYW